MTTPDPSLKLTIDGEEVSLQELIELRQRVKTKAAEKLYVERNHGRTISSVADKYHAYGFGVDDGEICFARYLLSALPKPEGEK